MNVNIIKIRPVELIYIQSLIGGCEDKKIEYLKKTANTLKKNPETRIKLVTAFDDIGDKTPLYSRLDFSNVKIDLDILQLLGYVPGSVRASRTIFRLLNERIPDITKLFNNFVNNTCFIPEKKYYKAGQLEFTYDNSNAKKSSCDIITNSNMLFIRMHHILCMTCYMEKGDEAQPITEDNLFEFWNKIKNNPDINITVTEGCQRCMICPPCGFFDKNNKKCISQGALRDRKKDLDVFNILKLRPNDTLKAKNLLKLVYDKIHTIKGICDYGKETLPEWKACQGDNKYGDYKVGRAYIKSILNI